MYKTYQREQLEIYGTTTEIIKAGSIERLKGNYMAVVNVYCVKWAHKMGFRSICYAHMG